MTLGQTLKEWAEPAAVRRGENVPSHNEIVHSSLTGGCTNGLENSLLGKEDLCLDWEAEIQPFQWGICPQTPPLVAPRTAPPSDGSSVLWFELGSSQLVLPLPCPQHLHCSIPSALGLALGFPLIFKQGFPEFYFLNLGVKSYLLHCRWILYH